MSKFPMTSAEVAAALSKAITPDTHVHDAFVGVAAFTAAMMVKFSNPSAIKANVEKHAMMVWDMVKRAVAEGAQVGYGAEEYGMPDDMEKAPGTTVH